MAFTGLDLYFPNISSINTRKTLVLVELVASGNDRVHRHIVHDCFRLGILVFLWFIGFCYMTDQWRQEPEKNKDGWDGRNSVQAALGFAFISFCIWVRRHANLSLRLTPLHVSLFRLSSPSSLSVATVKVSPIYSRLATKIIPRVAHTRTVAAIHLLALLEAFLNPHLRPHSKCNPTINHLHTKLSISASVRQARVPYSYLSLALVLTG